MGLIRFLGDVVGAGLGAIGSAANSMVWKEYFVSGDMSNGVLMTRGQKVLTEKGKNTKTDDNLISSGSGIDVQENQCAIIVDNGKIVEFCNEAGKFIYDSSSQPSLFSGNNKGLGAFGKEILNQWAAGGQRFSTQRVYFINMGDIMEPLKWGLGNASITHSYQPNVNIQPIRTVIKVKCHGSIGIRITNPVEFYKKLGAQKAGGDNDGRITVDSLGDKFTSLKHQIGGEVSKALTKVSMANPIHYQQISAYGNDIATLITEGLQGNSLVAAGFEFYDFFINGNPEASDDDYEKIRALEEKYSMVSDPMLAAYGVQQTMAEGFKEAGKNGGVTGIVGMGMAMNNGVGGLGNFQGYPQAQPYQQPTPQAQPTVPPVAPTPTPTPQSTSPENSWTCTCGHVNTGKFCAECGAKQPAPVENTTWTCSCGAVNTGKFCPECGSKKPEPKKTLKCDKCGWVAAEGQVTKFCPECGDPVTESDFE